MLGLRSTLHGPAAYCRPPVGRQLTFQRLQAQATPNAQKAALAEKPTLAARPTMNARSIAAAGPAPEVQAWAKVQEAQKSGTPVSGTVQSSNKGGVIVLLEGGLKGFVPLSALVQGSGKADAEVDLSALVGKSMQVVVTQAEEPKAAGGTREIFLSERRVLEAAALRQLQVGQVVSGTVASMTDYGAFVKLDRAAGSRVPLTGLVQKVEVSWDVVPTVESVLTAGQKVSAKVLSVEPGSGRLALSIRQTLVDPLKQTKEQLEWTNGSVSVPEILDLVRQLRRQQGVDGVTVTRQAMAIHVAAQELELYMTRGAESGPGAESTADAPGYLVIARVGVHYQELLLQTVLSRAEVKEVMQRAIAAVAVQP